MTNTRANILLLFVLWLLLAGAGTYVTFVDQPEELVITDEAEKALAIERAELRDLAMLEGRMRQEISYAAQRWQARYKTVPGTLTTPDVIAYVNESAPPGISSFNVEFAGTHAGQSHHYHAFNIRGSGTFEHLYDFLWQMENTRDLYRVEDLVVEAEGAEPSRDVQFTMRLLSYFGAAAIMSAPEGTVSKDDAGTLIAANDRAAPMLPADVLPARRPGLDPFSPMRTTPTVAPAGSVLFSLRSAALVFILGEVAIFERGGKQVRVTVGLAVREGMVTAVDAVRSRVVVTDDAGHQSVFTMDMPDPLYRRATGPVRIVPVG
jgi:hypothetical protein